MLKEVNICDFCHNERAEYPMREATRICVFCKKDICHWHTAPFLRNHTSKDFVTFMKKHEIGMCRECSNISNNSKSIIGFYNRAKELRNNNNALKRIIANKNKKLESVKNEFANLHGNLHHKQTSILKAFSIEYDELMGEIIAGMSFMEE